MTVSRIKASLPAAVLGACLAACGGTVKFGEDADGDTQADEVTSDTVVDTASDSPADSTVDTPTDTPPDTAADTAFDTAIDTAVDTAVDTVFDTVPDTSLDTPPDTYVDPDVVDTTPEIPPEVTCSPASSISCGGSVTGTNNGAGSTDILQESACSWYTETGPEIAYSFTATGDTRLTLDLTGLTADLDLFLLGQTAGMCDPGSCRGYSAEATTTAEHIEQTVWAGQTVYVLVEGYNDAVGSFVLTAACASGETCWNGTDDDGDGAADCGDSDCMATTWCPEYCSAASTLSCGSFVSGSTATAGTPDLVDVWSCGFDVADGPEMVYSFSTSVRRTVTAELSGHDPNLDVFVLEDTGMGCVSTSCVMHDMFSAVFAAEASRTYYVVVDGLAGYAGAYQINVTCE